MVISYTRGSFLLAGLDVVLNMHSLISFCLLALSIFFLPISKAYESSEVPSLRLVHRVVHPNLPVTPWSELGTVTLPPFASIQPTGSHASLSLAESLLNDLADFAKTVNPNMQGAMYHVAIEHSLSEDAVWPVSSMKAVGRILLWF